MASQFRSFDSRLRRSPSTFAQASGHWPQAKKDDSWKRDDFASCGIDDGDRDIGLSRVIGKPFNHKGHEGPQSKIPGVELCKSFEILVKV
jgi:hypothetical protein